MILVPSKAPSLAFPPDGIHPGEAAAIGGPFPRTRCTPHPQARGGRISVRRWSQTALITSTLLSLPSASAEGPVRFSAHGAVDGIIRQHQATEFTSSYFEEVHNIQLLASGGPWELGLRVAGVRLGPLDSDGYPPVDLVGTPWDEGPALNRLTVPEKLWARYRTPRGEITLGDFSTALGRGIGLNLLRNQALDLDTTVQGARGILRNEQVHFEVLAGVVHPRLIALQNANEDISDAPRDFVQAFRLEVAPSNVLSVNAWGTGFVFYEDPSVTGTASLFQQASSLDATILGGSLHASVAQDRLDLYGEGNYLEYLNRNLFERVDPSGLAIYGSATGYFGPWTTFLEVKRYRNAEAINLRVGSEGYEFITPPTLELASAVTRDSAETINSPDIVGYHMRIDRYVSSRSSLFSLNFGHFYDLDPLPPTPSKESIGHVYGQWEWTPPEGGLVTSTLGYRLDVRSIRIYGENQTWHGELNLESRPVAGWTGTLDLIGRRFSERTDGDFFEFKEFDLAAGLTYEDAWSLSSSLQYTDDPVILNGFLLGGGTGNLGDAWFGSVRLAWIENSQATVDVFIGARRAGLNCAGGQCRFLPAFSGVTVNTHFLF